MRKTTGLFFLAWAISGCATNPRIESFNAAQRAKLATIEAYERDANRPYDLLGTVSGLSCNRNKYQAQDISYDEAIQGVKMQAVLLGGDAVINTFCQKNSDTDWINNCWASIKCIGDAIRYK